MAEKTPVSWKEKLYLIIFESDTPAGKTFDVVLLWAILLSIVVVILESVQEINQQYGKIIRWIEYVFTILFTIEYIIRIIIVKRKHGYIFSFLGIVDFLAIIPTYLSFFMIGTQYLLVIRTIRLLRVFRIFKLAHFMGEAETLRKALNASKHKIIVFLFSVFSLTIIMGTLMYLIEGEENGFTSIPISIYWAIITLTTVGYGDIAPVTALGRALAALIMITGYSIIAVPTGIVTAELTKSALDNTPARVCPVCKKANHEKNANFCNNCGTALHTTS
jgi:voltage-gated potassium channel